MVKRSTEQWQLLFQQHADSGLSAFGHVFNGGKVNYIAVGVLAGRRNWSKETLKNAVILWNMRQFNRGEGAHNLSQINPGFSWAEYGRQSYANPDSAKFENHLIYLYVPLNGN